MNIKLQIALIVVILSFFIPIVSGIGLSPPQLRLMESPMGENMKVGNIVVTNTGTEPDYMVFMIGCLASTRSYKLRVICNGCGRDVGIQRGDLLHPKQIKSIINETVTTKENISANISSFPNATVGDYVLIKDNFVQRIIPIEKKDGSFCPFCNSDVLIFYDFTPDEILDNISLNCSTHPLKKKGSRFYYTVDEMQPGEGVEVDIYVNIPDSKSYYDKHWEARIMATTVDDVEGVGEFIVYGAETKFLIDTQSWVEEKAGNTNYVFVAVPIGGVICIFVAVLFFKTRKKEVALSFPEDAEKSSSHKIVKSIKGHKLL